MLYPADDRFSQEPGNPPGSQCNPGLELVNLAACKLKRPDSHSVIQYPVKGPQSKPLGKPGYGVVSVVLNVSGSE